jgi:hypothetical protein
VPPQVPLPVLLGLLVGAGPAVLSPPPPLAARLTTDVPTAVPAGASA